VGSYPPEPALGDLRGSGQIGDLASNVMFVYRHEEEDAAGHCSAVPGPRAYVEFAKVRMGVEGRVDLVFQGSRMRFIEPPAPGTVGTYAEEAA
jgi:replicative DNA helicase